ncbi:MAG: TfoX/Sxy family protein [Verrucomicrobiae bacterium]|nr:TfoX/Sxy family protein [Verrucomicrobiae bacterium]
MARDPGLEELIHDELDSVPGLTEKAMFGGWAWLLNGHLLCAARKDGMLVRLGKEREAWALQINGVEPMLSRGRTMQGWVRCDPEVFGDDAVRRKLLSRAIEFVRALPGK